MIVLTKDEFVIRKTSDSIVILGSGFSINKITSEKWSEIKSVNSISFNWFCKHVFAPTFFLVREQANIKNRVCSGETPEILYNLLNRDEYIKNTSLILANFGGNNEDVLDYSKKLYNFNGSGVVLKDIRGRFRVKHFKKDIFAWGMHHGECTMTNVLHVCIFLGYKNIYFAGVDLYDSRYFWLPKNKARNNVKKRNETVKNRHRIRSSTFKLIKAIKKRYSISMFAINKESLLSRIIPFSEKIK